MAGRTGKQKYIVVACNEDGEHLAEIEGAIWTEVSSLIAAWTKQFAMGMDAGQGLSWSHTGYIQIHPIFQEAR